MDYQTITLDITDGLAVLTLNRPDVMNALNTQMLAEILDGIRTAEDNARVLVLTGAGRAFCAGQDLGAGRGTSVPDLERILRDEYTPTLNKLNDCKIPTIAAVNGAAAGAGANIALMADVVIASENAVFLQAFSRIGLIPDAGGTYYLPRKIGMARAMGTALFAEPVSATQAAQWGMIWEAVPEADFDAHWRARAAHVAQGPTMAYGYLKDALKASQDNTFDAQLKLEAKLQGKCDDTRDFREGVLAFLEKRKPRFEGR